MEAERPEIKKKGEEAGLDKMLFPTLHHLAHQQLRQRNARGQVTHGRYKNAFSSSSSSAADEKTKALGTKGVDLKVPVSSPFL